MDKLWVDDIRDAPDRTWAVARSYEVAIQALKHGIEGERVREISLDHDLGEGKDGYDIAKFMARENIWPDKVQVHTMNPVGRVNICEIVKHYAPVGTELTVRIGGQ